MKDELPLGGALLQDGVDHVVLLLFGNTGWRRGWDVERHAWRNQSGDRVWSSVYICAPRRGPLSTLWAKRVPKRVPNAGHDQCVLHRRNSQKSQGRLKPPPQKNASREEGLMSVCQENMAVCAPSYGFLMLKEALICLWLLKRQTWCWWCARISNQIIEHEWVKAAEKHVRGLGNCPITPRTLGDYFTL